METSEDRMPQIEGNDQSKQQQLTLTGPCRKLLPPSPEDLLTVITDTSKMSSSMLSLLTSAVGLLYKGDHSSSLDLCQPALDKIWEELNTGYWKDVSVCWRQAYSLVSLVKALCEGSLLAVPGRNIDHAVILRTCDMGLLMGAPILGNILARMSREFQQAFGILGQWRRRSVSDDNKDDGNKLKSVGCQGGGDDLTLVSCDGEEKCKKDKDVDKSENKIGESVHCEKEFDKGLMAGSDRGDKHNQSGQIINAAGANTFSASAPKKARRSSPDFVEEKTQMEESQKYQAPKNSNLSEKEGVEDKTHVTNKSTQQETHAEAIEKCQVPVNSNAEANKKDQAGMAHITNKNTQACKTKTEASQKDDKEGTAHVAKKNTQASESDPPRHSLSHTKIAKIALPPTVPTQRRSDIPRCACPSVEMFQAAFMSTGHPVVITGAIGYWPALTTRRWTLEYLRSVAGCRTVPVELGARYTEESWTQKLMTIAEMIDQYILSEQGEETKAYLAQHQLFDQVWELRDDISVPVYCCLGEDEDVDTNAWFGPAGTVSPLHQDPKHNFLCQVMGEKYVRLYSDEHTECVYPHPTRLLHNTSQVDLDAPDLDKFPKFKDIPCLETVLKPGDMLYIPPGHWHYVKSLAVSFSVSFWWQ